MNTENQTITASIAVKKPLKKTMTIKQLEEAIFKHEGVRVIFRIDTSTVLRIGEYGFIKGLTHSTIATLRGRIQGVLAKAGIPPGLEFEIVDGSGQTKFGPKVTVQQVRNTYSYSIPR